MKTGNFSSICTSFNKCIYSNVYHLSDHAHHQWGAVCGVLVYWLLGKKEPQLVAFVDCCGLNTLTFSDFKLPMY